MPASVWQPLSLQPIPPLLVTGLIATAGIFSLWRLWIYALAFLLMGFVLARGWRRAGILTDAELSEFRYSSKAAPFLRALKALYFGTVFNCTVLAMVLMAAVRIAEPFLLWNQWIPGFLFDPVVELVQTLGVPLTICQRNGRALACWNSGVNADRYVSCFGLNGGYPS